VLRCRSHSCSAAGHIHAPLAVSVVLRRRSSSCSAAGHIHAPLAVTVVLRRRSYSCSADGHIHAPLARKHSAPVVGTKKGSSRGGASMLCRGPRLAPLAEQRMLQGGALIAPPTGMNCSMHGSFRDRQRLSRCAVRRYKLSPVCALEGGPRGACRYRAACGRRRA
jgi:hypothetical protein